MDIFNAMHDMTRGTLIRSIGIVVLWFTAPQGGIPVN